MPMRPVEMARYFSKVSAFILICVALHSLHVSVTSTTNGALDWHGGACSAKSLSQLEAMQACSAIAIAEVPHDMA